MTIALWLGLEFPGDLMWFKNDLPVSVFHVCFQIELMSDAILIYNANNLFQFQLR